MSNQGYRTDKPADTYKTHSLQTGIAPVGDAPLERQVSQKEKVEIWFIDPLRKLEGDDGFVCLLICFPLIEAVVRYELGVADDVDLKFSDNSPALKWIANFLEKRLSEQKGQIEYLKEREKISKDWKSLHSEKSAQNKPFLELW